MVCSSWRKPVERQIGRWHLQGNDPYKGDIQDTYIFVYEVWVAIAVQEVVSEHAASLAVEG
jgi:hypothetical protein